MLRPFICNHYPGTFERKYLPIVYHLNHARLPDVYQMFTIVTSDISERYN